MAVVLFDKFSLRFWLVKKNSQRLTIVHYDCGRVWQLSAMAITLRILVHKGWQLYTMFLTFFDKFPLWTWWYEIGWQFYHFFLFSIWQFSLMAMPFIHQEQQTYRNIFSKNHLKIQFDKFPTWLQPFFSVWQFSTVAVNFFWQFSNVAFTQKIKQNLVDDFTTFCLKIGWQFYFLTKVLQLPSTNVKSKNNVRILGWNTRL